MSDAPPRQDRPRELREGTRGRGEPEQARWSDLASIFLINKVSVYSSGILNGAKRADLPVVHSTKFVFAINPKAARLLGINVPRTLLAFADDLIE